MRPLQNKTRQIFFIASVIIFFFIAPFSVFYSLGYRINFKQQSVHSTGGIFIHSWTVNGNYILNGINRGSSNLLDRSQFFQGLPEGIYKLEMLRDGYTAWEKNISVIKEHVTDVSPFIIPLEPTTAEITKTIKDPTTLKTITNPVYKEVADLFIDKKEIIELDTTLPENSIERHKMLLYPDGDTLYAKWLGEKEVAPGYFCISIDLCNLVIPVLNSYDSSMHFDFYPGRNDIFIVNFPDGIYAIELDTRGGQNRELIYSGNDLNFRIDPSDKLFVKNKDHYYQIELK